MIYNIMKYLMLIWMVMLTSCSKPPPKHADHVCSVFKQYPSWYWAARKAQKRWHIAIATQMAIIEQESGYQSDIKPPRRHILWIIPWTRPSSASGYAQVLDDLWSYYKRSTGHHWASRDDFKDATDFIGWYTSMIRRRTGLSSSNVYALYLAYHEGIAGYQRTTYRNKPWLITVACHVAWTSYVYQRQLNHCAQSLPQHHGWLSWLLGY